MWAGQGWAWHGLGIAVTNDDEKNFHCWSKSPIHGITDEVTTAALGLLLTPRQAGRKTQL